MKYKRHIYGKRQVAIAGHIYIVRMEKDDLVVHRKYQREWHRFSLVNLVASLVGVLPMK